MIDRTVAGCCAGVLGLLLALALGGCTPGMSAAVSSARLVVKGSTTSADTAKLDPEFEYLRVTRGRASLLLWRGLIERTADGPVEVYYSGGGEVLRLRDGRLVGAVGLPVEWTRVEDRAPAWSALVKSAAPTQFVRTLDVMPGYRSGVRDELTLAQIAAPGKSALRAVDPQSLTWFQERRRGGGDIPPALYALDLSGAQPVVVYSEQCLGADFCFTWERWSSTIQQKAAARRSTTP